jgi:fructokinase
MDLIDGGAAQIIAVPGGGPFNVARTVARLGEPCIFFSGLSQDTYGRTIRQCLIDDGVTIALPEPLLEPSTTASVDLTGASPNYTFRALGTAAFQLDPQSTRYAWRNIASTVRILYVGSLGITFDPMASAITGLLEDLRNSVIVAFDPNCRPSAIVDVGAYRRSIGRILERSDVVKLSTEDLEFLFPDLPVEKALENIIDRGVACVVLTRGSLSVNVRLKTESFTLEVPSTEVIDSIGAGDALFGGLLAWWVREKLRRRDLANAEMVKRALSAAISVAVLSCERAGAQSPRLEELPRTGPWFSS